MSSYSDLKNNYDTLLKQKDLLQNQINAQDKINSLLETTAASISCGPDCQKIKQSDDLKQTYLDAETNIQIAPIKLEESKKNYYVFTKGENYYNNMLEEELKNKADILALKISESFNEELSSSLTMNQFYDTALINSSYTKELLDSYIKKNSELKLKLRDKRGDILTNDRKTYYETSALERLQLWYKFWWYLYYISVIVFLLAIFISPSKLSFLIKFIVLVLLVFYPYYVDYLVTGISDFFKKINNNLPKSVYNNL
jgi:hypothetical protein